MNCGRGEENESVGTEATFTTLIHVFISYWIYGNENCDVRCEENENPVTESTTKTLTCVFIS